MPDVLKDKFGLSLPLSDLFRWGMDSDDGSGLTEASFVGPAKINGASPARVSRERVKTGTEEALRPAT